jgi:hypothetical protein
LNECEVGCTGFQGVFLFIQQQMKTGFILHLDSLSVLDELTNEQAGILFKAIRDYNLGKEPELDFAMRMAFLPFKNQFERDLEKYQSICERNKNNGSLGGRPKKPKETEKTQMVLEEPKKADNNNKNDNKNDSIEERKLKFANSLSAFLETYGRDLLNDFYFYWTEHGTNDKKLRFEKEKTFGIEQRLRTWFNRNPTQYQKNETDHLVEYVNKQLGL